MASLKAKKKKKNMESNREICYHSKFYVYIFYLSNKCKFLFYIRL